MKSSILSGSAPRRETQAGDSAAGAGTGPNATGESSGLFPATTAAITTPTIRATGSAMAVAISAGLRRSDGSSSPSGSMSALSCGGGVFCHAQFFARVLVQSISGLVTSESMSVNR